MTHRYSVRRAGKHSPAGGSIRQTARLRLAFVRERRALLGVVAYWMQQRNETTSQSAPNSANQE